MARAYRGRPPKRRVTVRKENVNPGSFFGADNYERLRQEVATQGTIEGETLTPEQRKEAFKASRDKTSFNKFVNAFFGRETQTGGGVASPPPISPTQRMLPGSGTSAITVRRPSSQQTARDVADTTEDVADEVKQRKKRKSGATLEQNVAAIRKTVDSIFDTLVKQNEFIKKQFGLAKKLEEDKKRKTKEERFESDGKADKKTKKAVDKVVKPFSNILDKIFNFFSAIFLGKALIGLVNWFGDPENQSKVETIGRFLSDWWPTLLGAYLIFGNGLSKFVLGLTAKLVFFAGKMLLTVIPALTRAIARNPKAAAAALLLGAGAFVPAMFPDTVKDAADKQASEAEKEVGKEQAAAQFEAQNEDRNIFQKIGDFITGAGAERVEQAERLRTGEEKRYGFFGEIPAKRKGGKVTTTSGTDIKGAGVDTQLIAARPGEVVINKATVDAVGSDYFLGLNRKFGGPQANKPKMAKGVQTAAFGGLVVPAFANGGEVPVGGSYMGRRGEGLRDDLIKWAMANPALASTLKAGDTGFKEAQAAATNYANAVYNNGLTGLEQGVNLAGTTAQGFGTKAQETVQNLGPQLQQTVETLGPQLEQNALSIANQSQQFLANTANTGESIARDVQQRYESGELQSQIQGGLSRAKTAATDVVGGAFDPLISATGSKTYQGLSERNALVDAKEIALADSIVDSLPEGSPLQDIADKGLIPIPTGNAQTMRNLTFVKALLGPLGKPFKILSNDEVDRMRQLTIDKTLEKSGLIVGKDGEVRMNWNQEDINKGAKGGGAYTDDLGPGGKAFNSILGRFTASTRDGGNTLYTDDRYNFNLSTQEYLQKAKDQLLSGAFGEAAYFGAASLGKFAEDMGWLNQRALGSRIAVGQVDRTQIEGATPKVAQSAPINVPAAVKEFEAGNYDAATRALGGDPSTPEPIPQITAPVKPKREWYDPRGWIGMQGGGMVGPSWMPWNWGKAVDKGRNEATLGGNAFGYNARYKNVTDPNQRRMLGLPPLESRQGGGMVGPSWLPWNWGKVVDKGRKGATLGGNRFGYEAKYGHVTDPNQRRMLGLPPLESRQGGGMVGPSWLPWNWGKAVDKGRDEATLGGNAFGYNARYKNVTDPNQRRMLGLPPLEGRAGGGITESTGMNLPGAGADRQLIRVQPGEYILPVDTVMRLGGPRAIDNIVARTDSNSTAAKLGLNKPSSMAVGQPVMSDGSSMVSTLPPIVQASGGGGYGNVGKGPEVPSVSVSSNASRRRAKTMFGLVG